MSGERILVVDDEPHIIQLAPLYLEREGYQVQSAGDGLRALEATKLYRPDLIILDIMLPRLDGLEICRRLRSENNPVAILMLTARNDDLDSLGLAIAREIVLAHQGSITVQNNPRQGCTFSVILPVLRPEDLTLAAKARPK